MTFIHKYIHTCIHTYIVVDTDTFVLIYVYMHTGSPDLLLAMIMAEMMRTNEMTTMVILAEAIATGTTMLFLSAGVWAHVAGTVVKIRNECNILIATILKA